MIDTLFFALQIIGIVILLGWAVIHDRVADGGETVGPLAFKQPVEPASAGKRLARSRTSDAGPANAASASSKRRRSIRST